MSKLIPTNYKNLKRDPESGVYYWRQFVEGKEFLRSTGERKNETRAYKIGQRMFAEWVGKPEAMRRAQFQFDDLARAVLDLKAIKSPKTLISANLHIHKHLMPFFGGYSITSITEAMWEEYIVQEHRKCPTRKLFNDRKHLIMIMRYAYKRGLLPRPLEFRNPDPTEMVGKEYTEEEIRALISHAGTNLRLQIDLAYKNGMRRKEILSLQWAWLDLEEGYIHLPREATKIRRARSFPVNPDVLPALVARFKDAEGPFVFPSPSDPNRAVLDNKTAWFRCKRAAGVRGRFHDLVHTFMSWGIYKYNIPLTALCAIAGKSIVVAEKRYIHARASNLKAAVFAFRGIRGDSETMGENVNEIARV